MVPNIRTILAVAALGACLTPAGLAAKKNKEDETQSLQLPRDLPAAVAGETRRLGFLVTPLSAKGLLSQQVRDALKNLERQAGPNTVLHIRAFVAGTGDLRRVRDLVSETFTERHQPLPALSLVQAGGLPLPGAQVVLEAITNSRRDLDGRAMAFFPAQAVYADDSLTPVVPLLDRTLAGLRRTVEAAGAAPSDVLRLTCFVSSLDQFEAARGRVQAEYPHAAVNYVQAERAPPRALAACEAAAGLRQPGAAADHPAVAFIASPHVVLSGTQVSFGYQEQDAHLAFERLEKTLEPLGASLRDVALAHFYPLSPRISEQVRRQLPAFFERNRLPAVSLLEFEGLSSADAAFAVDVVAAGK